MISETPTPYAVNCFTHGKIFLTYEEYMRQLSFPDNGWICPICAESANWDDDNYESFQIDDEEE